MVRQYPPYSNQHKNKLFFTAKTSAEVYRCRIHIAMGNSSPHFSCYGKQTSINEPREFVYDMFPITPKPNKLYNITKEG